MNFRVSCLILSCLLALSSCAAQGEELSPAPVAATPSAAAATPSPTPTPTPTPTPVITQAQLDQAVAQAGSDHGAMAVQAAVIRDGEVVLESAWGWAVTRRWRTASISCRTRRGILPFTRRRPASR